MRLTIASMLILACAVIVNAQETEYDSTSFQQLLDRFLGAEKLHISLITQAGFSIVDNGSNTQSQFDNLEFRLYMKGKLSPQFSYYSQVKATSTSWAEILDLRLTYSPTPNLFFDIGKFKIPFSKEYLRGQNELTFIRLSSVGRNLGLGRDQGFQARANAFDTRLSGSLAVFNGGTSSNPEKASVISTRVFAIPFHTLHDLDGFRCEIGGSFVYSKQRGDLSTVYHSEYYTNKRLWSTDLRLQYDHIWIEGEGGWMYAEEGLDQVRCTGSAGYVVAKEYELVARFDFGELAASDEYWYFQPKWIAREYTFGINWHPEEDLKLQVNYVRDQSQSSNAALLNFQYTINHD